MDQLRRLDPTTENGSVETPAPAQSESHRWRWKSMPWPLRILGYGIGLLLLAWLILFITKGRFLKKPFETIASRSLGRDVSVGGDFQLYLAPINIKFRAEKLRIANPDWAGPRPFFLARLVDTRIALLSLLSDRKRARWLQLDQGALDLRWSADHSRNTWTFGDQKAKGKKLELPVIDRASLAGTTVHYEDPRMFLRADMAFDTIRSTSRTLTTDIDFTGDGAMRGHPFTLKGALLSPNETVTGGENRLELHAQSGPTIMDVAGTLPAATQIEGADLRIAVRGPNLARLFDLLGVAIPETRVYRIKSALTYVDSQWRFTHLVGRFGTSDIAGRMTVSQPQGRLYIAADLRTDTLDIIDAGPFIGYDPQHVSKTGTVVQSTSGHPRVLPDAPLRIEAIRGFDAQVKYKIRRVRAESFPLSNIELTLGLDHSLLTLSPLNFDMAAGFVSSDISINARRQPVHTQYDVRLSPTPMGKLLAQWGVEESGTTGTIKARIQMSGDGDTLHKSLSTSNGRIAIVMPAGTMWARNIQLSELDIGTFVWKMFQKRLKDPVQINCGLVAFTVRDGIAAADPILIDTRKNVIIGRGGFSFRDERLDLSVRADGKKLSLFSAQSPIGVGGWFAAPSINPISPELITRAGAGVGAAALLSPLAGILAFVDIGDAKSASCGPVLAGASASAQRTSKGKPRDDVGHGTLSKREGN